MIQNNRSPNGFDIDYFFIYMFQRNKKKKNNVIATLKSSHKNNYCKFAMAIISVFVDRVTNLADSDLFGKSDPYVKLDLKQDVSLTIGNRIPVSSDLATGI
jgi:hypothetical protein